MPHPFCFRPELSKVKRRREAPMPVTLHIDSESREITLEHYTILWQEHYLEECSRETRLLVLNSKTDLLYVERWDVNMSDSGVNTLFWKHQKFFDAIRTLEIRGPPGMTRSDYGRRVAVVPCDPSVAWMRFMWSRPNPANIWNSVIMNSLKTFSTTSKIVTDHVSCFWAKKNVRCSTSRCRSSISRSGGDKKCH
jgi:hypothetical protein